MKMTKTGLKSYDANFLKFIVGNSGDNKENICLHRNDPFITF